MAFSVRRAGLGILFASPVQTIFAVSSTNTSTTQCPAATWPFRNGSYCCRCPLDEEGLRIAYGSQTCYGNDLFACPPGEAKIGQCQDLPVQASSVSSFRGLLPMLLPTVALVM
ncbi:unnamed protein product [Polarella glacialis]|uniref:Uncharacterized protein n=1 Tax=Polarella glacialis TaxID=89957 RepID=A0A813FZQ5_POLGL|nr:unnamed protein product [Polarella glacialis]